VDDNAEFLDSTKDVLEDAGYMVMTAANGEEALSLAREQTFKAILMDIKMPGLNGVETFLKMKEQNPKVRVILFTAYSVNELIQRAFKEGVYDVLFKPLDMPRLLKLIKEIRERWKGKGCILIVDDDRSLCDNLHDTLDHAGYKVTTSFDGAQAVKKAKTNTFDILLLDMKMPGINGLEVYRKIKKSQPHLVTIIITGYAEEFSDLITQTINESAYVCVKKPIEIDKLLSLLEEVSADKT
jgi:DNA-binding NtrC family response regulator